MKSVTIAVLGIWHQGAVLSACFADQGYRVEGIVRTEEEAQRMNRGLTPVLEPGLSELIRKGRRSKRLTYTTDPRSLRLADFIFISHDTPVDKGDYSDLADIMSSVGLVASERKKPGVVCVTAQVPVGTCDEIETILRSAISPKMQVLYVPEFLRLGTALESFRHADRIVIGGPPAPAKKVAALYEPLKRPIVVLDRRSAEMAKHACNAFLAASISFINEIADLCEEVGADAGEVAQVMKLDRRIGPWAFLTPGLGFAGGTLGREIRALQKLAARAKRSSALMDAIWEVNQSRPAMIVDRLRSALGPLKGKKVAILGLTYKSGTSSMRNPISLEIISRLLKEKAEVAAYDPLADMNEVRDRPGFDRVDSPEDLFVKTDAAVLLTEWPGLKDLNWKAMRKKSRGNLFFDTRNLLDPSVLTRAGFLYVRVGRGS